MKKKIKKLREKILLLTLSITLIPTTVFANPNVAALDNLITQQIVPWVQRGGMVIAFVGGLMFAAGWRNDDADSKARGVNTLISGFMIAGIATAYTAFVS